MDKLFQKLNKKLSKILGDHYNDKLTEKDNMLINEALIIYDCGQRVFEWRK